MKALWFFAVIITGLGAAHATTYQVGPTRTYPTVTNLPALNPGDVVQINAATYNVVKRWTHAGTAANPIVIQGVGATRPIFDAVGVNVDGTLPHPRGIFQVEANYVTIENLEFKRATNGNNAAGIRVLNANDVIIRNCKITLCDMGMMSDNNRNLVIESSEIASNGTARSDGYSHNFYLAGNNATVRDCYIHDSLNGQNFKSRGHYTELLYNYIADSQDGEVGLVDSSNTGTADSHAVMIGNVVISKPRLSGYNSSKFVDFGQDSGGQHTGTLFAFHNTFIGGDGRIQFLNVSAAGASIDAHDNIFFGSLNLGNASGSNNWAQTGATIPAGFAGTVTGSDPGFVNRGARDFHLTAASACVNRGVSTLTYLDGNGAPHAGTPTLEYVNHLQTRPRPADGQLDLGAYELFQPSVTGASLTAPNVHLDCTTDTGRAYDLQRANDLTSGGWSNVVTNIAGTGSVVQITDTNAAISTQRFYRVRQAP